MLLINMTYIKPKILSEFLKNKKYSSQLPLEKQNTPNANELLYHSTKTVSTGNDKTGGSVS